jgi:uncharacterized protein
MPLLEKDLIIKKSTLPGAGKGLFTKKAIPKGANILQYKGRIKRGIDARRIAWKNVYIFHVTPNHIIDAANKKYLARYANDAMGFVRDKKIKNNCIFVNEKKKIYIQSSKKIPAGSEILVGYGKEYWQALKDNMKEAK